MIEREAHAESELSVVFEQRIAPGRSASFAIDRVRRRRQIAAVDARTTGRVRDDRAIAKELRHQLDVRRLAAAGARAGEFKQRLEQLNVLDVLERQIAVAMNFRQRQEIIPVDALAVAQRQAAAPC